MKNLQTLYTQLGNLFYSIAAADNTITSTEIARLQAAVKEKWLPLENSTDFFGTDAAQYINIQFDYLQEEMPTAADAYERFEVFYKDHSVLFTHEMKHLIIDTARSIANAFASINKSELNLLGQLTVLFNK